MTADRAEPKALEIPRDIFDAMIAHCVNEAPLECCGILGGVAAPLVTSIYLLCNESQSETRYSADPHDLINTQLELRRRGEDILAIYHSHPRWDPIPSRTDLAENYYGEVPRIIVSLLGDRPDVRVWRLEPDRFHELRWRVAEPPKDSTDA